MGGFMYKVSEVADLLSVEKTDIFEKMISHKALLEPNIKKIDGVTYFDQRGLEILKTLLLKNDISLEVVEDKSKMVEKTFDLGETSENMKSSTPSKFEKNRKSFLEQIEILKSELLKLDEEIALKDDLILGYQQKIFEDLDLIGKYQQQMLKKISRMVE